MFIWNLGKMTVYYMRLNMRQKSCFYKTFRRYRHNKYNTDVSGIIWSLLPAIPKKTKQTTYTIKAHNPQIKNFCFGQLQQLSNGLIFCMLSKDLCRWFTMWGGKILLLKLRRVGDYNFQEMWQWSVVSSKDKAEFLKCRTLGSRIPDIF